MSASTTSAATAAGKLPRSVRGILREHHISSLWFAWKLAAGAAVLAVILFAIDAYIPLRVFTLAWAAMVALVVGVVVIVTPLTLWKASRLDATAPLLTYLGATPAIRDARVAEVDAELARAELVTLGRHQALVAPSLVFWVGDDLVLLERDKVLGVAVIEPIPGRWHVQIQHSLWGTLSIELPVDDARVFASWFGA